jgi:HlyD family secretion protein
VKKLVFLLILIGGGMTAGAYWVKKESARGASAEDLFVTIPAEYGTLVDSVTATGLLGPTDVTAVGSLASGQVVKVYPNADYNHEVKKDEPLLQLDDRLAKQDLAQAQTAVELAKGDVQRAQDAREAAQVAYDRARELVEKQVGQQADLDRAKFALKAAERAIEMARLKVRQGDEVVQKAQLQLDWMTVKAPAAGRIIDRKVVQGQLIGPPASAQLFTIAGDLSRLKISAQIAESDVGKVRAGLEAKFTVYAYPDAEFHGRVDQVRDTPTSIPTAASPLSLMESAARQGAVYYTAVIEAPNRRDPKSGDWLLRPGMTATVEIRRHVHNDVWKIQAQALNFQPDEQLLTDEARAKLARWQEHPNHADWRAAWIVRENKPWPIFVRIGGANAGGEPGINDGQYHEVLEWDPELEPRPQSGEPSTHPRFIIQVQPPKKSGLFDRPLRVS